jgi:TolA-binding protein
LARSTIAPSVKLGLAVAYRKLGRPREAMPLLNLLAESAPDKELQDDALYELARCQDELQAWNDAKTTWRALIRRFPESRFAGEAKLALAGLQYLH